MDKTTTLMVRAACMVVILAPLAWFSAQWFDREAKVKECALIAWNLDVFGQAPGDEFYDDVAPKSGDGTVFTEPYEKALRHCRKTLPQVWSLR